jgi:hypothetical protein
LDAVSIAKACKNGVFVNPTEITVSDLPDRPLRPPYVNSETGSEIPLAEKPSFILCLRVMPVFVPSIIDLKNGEATDQPNL